MNLNVIRTLTIRAKPEGMSETTSGLKGVGAAYDDVTESATQSAKASDAFAKSQTTVAQTAERSARQLRAAAQINDQFTKAAQGINQIEISFQRAASANDNFVQGAKGIADAISPSGSKGPGFIIRELDRAITVLTGTYSGVEESLRRVGLENGVVTGALVKTHHGFVQVQNAADETKVSLSVISGGLEQVAKDADPAAKSAVSVANAVGLLAVGGLAAGITALSDKFHVLTSKVGELDAEARKAKTDVESFQRIQFATGGSTGNVTGALGGISDKLQEAIQKENSLSKLLDANNIKWREGDKLLVDNNQLLLISADLIKRAGSEADKAKIAERLGIPKDFIPQLEQGRQKIEANATEFDRLGLAISRGTIDKAKEFDENWKRSSLLASTYIKSWVAESIPLIDQLISAAGDFGKTIKDSLPAKGQGGSIFDQWENIKAVGGDIKKIVDVLVNADSAKDATKALDEIILKLWEDLNKPATTFLDELAQKVNEAAATLRESFNAISGDVPLPRSRPTIVTDEDADKKAKAWERLVNEIEKHTATLNADTEAVGKGVGEHARLRAVFQLEDAANRDGIEITAARRAEIEKLSQAVGIAAQKAAQASAVDKASFDSQTVFLSDTERQIASIQQRLHGNDWKAFMDDGVAQSIRLTSALKEIKDVTTSFSTDLVRGLMDGKSAMDSLANAAKNLSAKLTEGAINDLISGNYIGAAVKGAAAIGTYLFAKDSEKKKQQADDQAAAADRAADFYERAQRAYIDTGNRVGELASLEITHSRERVEELKKKYPEMVELEKAQAAEREAIDKKYNDTLRDIARGPLTDTAQALKDIKDASDGLADSADLVADATAKVADNFNKDLTSRLNTASGKSFLNDAQDLSDQYLSDFFDAFSLGITDFTSVNETFAEAAQKLVDDAGLAGDDFQELIDKFPYFKTAVHESSKVLDDATSDIQSKLNDALGKGYINDIKDLNKEISDALKAGVDSDLVKDYFKAKAQEIVDANNLAGESFTDLIAVFPELSGVVKESTADIQKASDDLAAAQSNIGVYLSNLLGGASSPLGPLDRLAAAQADYNQQLALANSTDTTTRNNALKTITDYSKTLLDAAKDVYGSATQFQDIFDRVVVDLGGLAGPTAVPDSLIPLLQDIANHTSDTTVKAEAIRIATNSTSTSSSSTATNVSQLTTLQTTANSLTSSANSLSSATNSLLDSINTLTNTGNSTLTSIQSISSTSSSTLTSINSIADLINKNLREATKQTGALTAIAQNTAAGWIPDVTKPYSWSVGGNGTWTPPTTFALGGPVTGGTPGADSVSAMLMPGEYVSRASTVDRLGVGFFDALNRGAIPATPLYGGSANDNSAIVSELRALRRDNAQLQRELERISAILGLNNSDNRAGHAMTAAAVSRHTSKVEAEGRREATNPRGGQKMAKAS